MWKASPMALVPVAQAVTADVQGPFNPCLIATFPAPKFMIVIGTKNGDTLFDFPVAILVHSVSIVSNPPIPDPSITPNLSKSSFSKSILNLYCFIHAANQIEQIYLTSRFLFTYQSI
jgi:hypothetical protein